MLSDWLRYERGLTGTKVVCAEGDCGACSVLRWFPLSAGEGTDSYLPINSCIVTVAQMDGSSLVTVDALSEGEKLAPAQKAMVACHGSQCGFCTPGFVVAISGLLEKKLVSGDVSRCTEREAKNALTGNLCRCTGYQPILDAATAIDPTGEKPLRDRFLTAAAKKELRKVLSVPLVLEGETFSFHAPRNAASAARYLRRNKGARIVGATTDLGVVHNKGKLRLTRLVSLHLVEELYAIRRAKGRVSVGARVTLSELRHALKKDVPEFARFLDLFASPQIKNVATLVGNVGNASPIADTPPFLLVTGARVNLVDSAGKKRSVPIEKFYLAYRKTALRPGEIIVSIDFEVPAAKESLALYKISQRKDLDISAVNAAFRVEWKDAERSAIRSIRLAYGGVAATPLRLKKTEAALAGAKLGRDLLPGAAESIHSEMKPMSDLRGTAAFRRVLVENLFARFLREHAGPSGEGKAQ
jgi:xanthine dehydrogenase small subunit